ncbi:MAG: pentapeptide repeat-containing protein [Deltaproteobacteria bacterium]|nr:pentapeptide repeat-containing protein [Deltaproteobacteria bacterium]
MSEAPPTCRIHEKYPEIECTNSVLPGDTEDLCILHSHEKGKGLAAFREALRARWTQEDAEFYDFRGVYFPDWFNPLNYFGSREFTKAADFSRATFTGAANFSLATFTDEAHFYNTTFMDWANFWGANFIDWADFGLAIFKKVAEFCGSSFVEEADFSGAKIFGRIDFQALNPQGKGKPPPSAFHGNFRGLELSLGAVLRFQDLSLAYCEFSGNDLRQVEFRHVEWYPYRGRQSIFEEMLLREEEKEDPWFWTRLSRYAPYSPHPSELTDKYGEVERLYRDLQENYDKARDYKKMGDFHYGEMEMHRRPNKWRWFPFYWYNLYWALSGYGERPSRAFGLLICFLAVLTGLLAWTGLEILDPKHSASFGNPFFYLLQKVTLQRPTWAEPVGFGGKLVAGLSVLLIPGQAALFLLALRNRLGRRR